MKAISRGLAAKVELGDRPGRGNAEDRVERNGDGGHEQGQFIDARASGSDTAASHSCQPLRNASASTAQAAGGASA